MFTHVSGPASLPCYLQPTFSGREKRPRAAIAHAFNAAEPGYLSLMAIMTLERAMTRRISAGGCGIGFPDSKPCPRSATHPQPQSGSRLWHVGTAYWLQDRRCLQRKSSAGQRGPAATQHLLGVYAGITGPVSWTMRRKKQAAYVLHVAPCTHDQLFQRGVDRCPQVCRSVLFGSECCTR